MPLSTEHDGHGAPEQQDPRGSAPGDVPVALSPAGAQARERSAVQERLARRTQEILERPRPEQDPDRADREKAVMRECRYLMRLLATRRRSRGEMLERLERREVPGSVAHEVMARIERADLVDDRAFAHEWVRQRRELRSLGDRGLRRELEQRHVDGELIEEALRAGGAGRGPEGDPVSGEEERCRELVRSRLGERDLERLAADRDGSQRRRLSRRLDALLTRKGYPGDLAVQVISSELRRASGR